MNPTYRNLGGHSEAIQVDYDPEKISYEELLDVFWDSHDPTTSSWSRQYKKAIFYHDEEQKRSAQQIMDRLATAVNKKIVTELLAFDRFYLAEDYHQKYRLRSNAEILDAYETIYPDINAFVSSSAVAKVNGYLGGYGSCEELESEINDFGLPQKTAGHLIREVCRGTSRMSCPAGGCGS